jgi:TrmH family RNA methyltransferase
MSVRQIVSKGNPFFRDLLELAEDRRSRRASGRTLIDGEHLLEEAIHAGMPPRHLIVRDDSDRAGAWAGRLPGVPVTMLAPALFGRLSPVATPTGVLAVIDVPRPAATGEGGFVMLLEDIQDPGNLGSLLRTAAAAGVDAVHLSPGCAEAWSPKALRGGQGGHFRLRIHEDADLVQVVRQFPGRVLAAALRQTCSLFALDLAGSVAFAFGNEGAGLSQGLLAEVEAFSIPMPGQVESLNVAAAAAICLFERVRQQGG